MQQLRLKFNTLRILPFFPLLQTGIHIPIEQSISVQTLFSDVCDLTDAVIENRIQTLFLNGNPVDDFKTAMVNEGDILALSAAMPGLVGATMRSGGKLACFRSNISHRDKPRKTSEHTGTISLKLFNLLLRELGPGFLSRGVLIPAGNIDSFLHDFKTEDWQACNSATLNGKPIEPAKLAQTNWPADMEMIELQVFFD